MARPPKDFSNTSNGLIGGHDPWVVELEYGIPDGTLGPLIKEYLVSAGEVRVSNRVRRKRYNDLLALIESGETVGVLAARSPHSITRGGVVTLKEFAITLV